MSIRNALLAIAERARSITGAGALDVRPHQLTVRVRTWSGSRVKQGTSLDSDLVLPQHYPVRLVKQIEIDRSGGQIEVGDILVDNITPDPVGYTPRQLKPLVEANQERIYVLSGPHEGFYSLVELRTFKAFSYSLVLRRRADTP